MHAALVHVGAGHRGLGRPGRGPLLGHAGLLPGRRELLGLARGRGRDLGALRLPLLPGGHQVPRVASLRELLLERRRLVSAHDVLSHFRLALQDAALRRPVVVRDELLGVVLEHARVGRRGELLLGAGGFDRGAVARAELAEAVGEVLGHASFREHLLHLVIGVDDVCGHLRRVLEDPGGDGGGRAVLPGRGELLVFGRGGRGLGGALHLLEAGGQVLGHASLGQDLLRALVRLDHVVPTGRLGLEHARLGVALVLLHVTRGLRHELHPAGSVRGNLPLGAGGAGAGVHGHLLEALSNVFGGASLGQDLFRQLVGLDDVGSGGGLALEDPGLQLGLVLLHEAAGLGDVLHLARPVRRDLALGLGRHGHRALLLQLLEPADRQQQRREHSSLWTSERANERTNE